MFSTEEAQRGAAMVALQHRLLAQRVDVAADGLRRDREALRQRVDADEALAPDQLDDLRAALLVAGQPARLPAAVLFACEHATAGWLCKPKWLSAPSRRWRAQRGRARGLEPVGLEQEVEALGPGTAGRAGEYRGQHHRQVRPTAAELPRQFDAGRCRPASSRRRTRCRRRGRRRGRPAPPRRWRRASTSKPRPSSISPVSAATSSSSSTRSTCPAGPSPTSGAAGALTAALSALRRSGALPTGGA